MNLRCLIIDDEPLALYVIQEHVKRIPFLEVVAECHSAMEALEILRTEQIDLIFIDIQMPEITGIELIQSLTYKPQIIFTTSYPEFALESYDLGATDYLLKPISFERFMRAINKLDKPTPEKPKDRVEEAPVSRMEEEYIFVKTDYKNVKLYLKDILFVEGLKEYVVFHMADEKIISLLKMKNIEEQLPGHSFVRVHRSFIISLSKIDFIERNRIFINDNWIPVGLSYKGQFEEMINAKKLS